MALLAVTNKSAKTCWVKGTVTFALTTVDGGIVDARPSSVEGSRVDDGRPTSGSAAKHEKLGSTI
jgi:hypothetical protein